MNCSDIHRMLDEHRLTSLSAAERSDFDAHLADCDACFGAVSAHETLIDDVPEAPRDGLMAAIVSRIPQSARIPQTSRSPLSDTAGKTRTSLFGWQFLGGVAAMGVLVLIAVLATTGRETSGLQERGAAARGESAGDAAGAGTSTAESGALLGQQPLPERMQPSPFIESVDYVVLPVASAAADLPDRIRAWVFFMWSCLHCYEFDAIFSDWSADRDDSVGQVARVPVQWNPAAELHARAFYTAEVLGVTDAINDAFFGAIHEEAVDIGTRDEIAALFSGVGVDRATFDAAFDSVEVESRLERGRALASEFRIDSTPTVIVDGRYRTSPGLAGSHERVLDVVEWLLARGEADARAGEPPAVESCDYTGTDSADDDRRGDWRAELEQRAAPVPVESANDEPLVQRPDCAVRFF